MNEPAVEPEKARGIIEAILLTAQDPVSPGRLTGLLDGFNGRDIRQAIDELKISYERNGHGITIVEVAGGFQLATREEMAPWLRKFHRERSQTRLSQAALETLSIIAFKQPITRVEIDNIRGVNSAGVVQTLMEQNMIRIVGRSDGIGKPMLFGTTREFLILFGLKTLADLPRPRELEELLAEGEQKARQRDQLALDLGEEEEAREAESAPEEDLQPTEESTSSPSGEASDASPPEESEAGLSPEDALAEQLDPGIDAGVGALEPEPELDEPAEETDERDERGEEEPF